MQRSGQEVSYINFAKRTLIESLRRDSTKRSCTETLNRDLLISCQEATTTSLQTKGLKSGFKIVLWQPYKHSSVAPLTEDLSPQNVQLASTPFEDCTNPVFLRTIFFPITDKTSSMPAGHLNKPQARLRDDALVAIHPKQVGQRAMVWVAREGGHTRKRQNPKVFVLCC